MGSESFEPVRVVWSRLVQIQRIDSSFAGRSGSFGAGLSWGTSVNESRTVALRINSLKVDHKLGRIVLGVRKYFSAVECNDMIRDDLHSLGGKVGIVDAKVTVEPVDLVGYEFTRNKTLDETVR